MNTARFYMGHGGTSTAALGFGGDTGSKVNTTEEWNGTGLVTSTVTTTSD